MMAGPNVPVSTPQRKPRKGGIKSVVGEFVTTDRLGAGAGIEWISDGCEFPKAAPGLCYVDNSPTGNKEFVGVEVGSGPIFALYAGVKCYLGPSTDYAERAARLLEQGEGRGVEEVLWEWAATTGGAPNAATSLLDAIALAEESADSYYVGMPVILMSRRVAVWARSVKAIFGDEETGQLWTANGTPVIATAAASDAQLSIIGYPTIYTSRESVNIDAIDPTTNQQMAIAERIYAIAVDCAFVFTYTVVAPTGTSTGGGVPEPLELTIGTEPASPIPDGTDTTITVHANREPGHEVHLFYRINGGAWVDNGETVEVDPLTYVENVDGTLASAGDHVDLYAKAGSTQSPTITIEVT